MNIAISKDLIPEATIPEADIVDTAVTGIVMNTYSEWTILPACLKDICD